MFRDFHIGEVHRTVQEYASHFLFISVTATVDLMVSRNGPKGPPVRVTSRFDRSVPQGSKNN